MQADIRFSFVQTVAPRLHSNFLLRNFVRKLSYLIIHIEKHETSFTLFSDVALFVAVCNVGTIVCQPHSEA